MNNNEEKCILDYEEFGSMSVKSLEGTAGTIEAHALMDEGDTPHKN